MRPGSALVLLCVLAGGSLACSGAGEPPARQTQRLISDEVHGNGTRGFFFLPPLVAHPTLSGLQLGRRGQEHRPANGKHPWARCLRLHQVGRLCGSG